MSIKASNSAGSGNLRTGIWLVLFAVLVLIITWLFRIPVKQTNDLAARLSDTDKQITSLKAVHAEILLTYNLEDNPFISNGITAGEKAGIAATTIKEHLSVFNNTRFIARKAEVKKSLEEMTTLVTGIEAELNNLYLILNERGNQQKGLVSQWVTLSRKMLDSSSLADDFIINNLQKVRLLESEYLLSHDSRILTNIASLMEEVRNMLSFEEEGISLMDLDQYMMLTANLAAVEQRMGNDSGTGIVPALQKMMDKLPVAFENTQQQVLNRIASNKKSWVIAYGVLLLLTIIIFVRYFVRFFSLADALANLSAFSKKIAGGAFPEDKMDLKKPGLLEIADALNQHVGSLKEKYVFTQSINNDQVDAQLKLAGESDLLGAELIQLKQKIAKNAEEQKHNDEENFKRRYLNEGLARFAEILRAQSNDFSMLSDAFIREMVKYLDAIQGGLFVLEKEEGSAPVLRLLSAFAYNRKKYLQKTVALGEGLVGTCAREKQYINLTEIPEGYIMVTSGLGDTPPDNLLLVPVLHENETLGVVEIASLKKFRDHEINFAREVAQTLGSTMVYTRNNEQTAELLAKSQKQALEMAEQEEEMRQNMEELKATQEESNRREEAFKGIADAMSHALMIVEYDLKGIISDINEKYCVFIGINRDNAIDKEHHQVFGGTLKPDEDFWKKVRHEKALTINEVVNINNNTYTLTEHFATVLNRDGVPVKYINFVING
ncbi:MAG: GAF domain-containing protein [Bacteroidales bacterium]|nr:GAF domain-containing protein [Bacteroidales bacterium]